MSQLYMLHPPPNLIYGYWQEFEREPPADTRISNAGGPADSASDGGLMEAAARSGRLS